MCKVYSDRCSCPDTRTKFHPQSASSGVYITIKQLRPLYLFQHTDEIKTHIGHPETSAGGPGDYASTSGVGPAFQGRHAHYGENTEATLENIIIGEGDTEGFDSNWPIVRSSGNQARFQEFHERTVVETEQRAERKIMQVGDKPGRVCPPRKSFQEGIIYEDVIQRCRRARKAFSACHRKRSAMPMPKNPLAARIEDISQAWRSGNGASAATQRTEARASVARIDMNGQRVWVGLLQRAGKMWLTARVARPPAIGSDLGFVAVQGGSLRAEREYLRQNVGGKPFHWRDETATSIAIPLQGIAFCDHTIENWLKMRNFSIVTCDIGEGGGNGGLQTRRPISGDGIQFKSFEDALCLRRILVRKATGFGPK
ncbi:hypothetical protein K438DRAFT_1781672 [Mycena galopus ATCC 62051]|nr:hypothetical protein K438DRAFT_1781672 [Mycena galopus ATCC 62051]